MMKILECIYMHMLDFHINFKKHARSHLDAVLINLITIEENSGRGTLKKKKHSIFLKKKLIN